MDIKDFYEQVKGVVLFPGSVDDLNKLDIIENRRHVLSEGRYFLMPVEGSRKYLTGAIIPSLNELREFIKAQEAGIGALQKSGLVSKLGELEQFGDKIGEVLPEIEEMAKQMYGNPEIMGADIRMKAIEIGADGLVHVQLFNKELTYIGVPVKFKL